MSIRTGDVAPDFELPTHKGGTLKLSDFRGKKHVVLFFYPKDETAGCTAEACSFRDNYEDFTAAGAEVVGISSDSEASHDHFASKHRLPFHLVSDRGGKTRAAYGVKSTFGLFPGRVTYLIDKQGVVRHVFSSQLNPLKHIEETLGILKRMSA